MGRSESTGGWHQRICFEESGLSWYLKGNNDPKEILYLTLFAVFYLHALNQIRDFRWRHWCFTRAYVLGKTKHPTATGGSPIVLVSTFPLNTALRGAYDFLVAA